MKTRSAYRKALVALSPPCALTKSELCGRALASGFSLPRGMSSHSARGNCRRGLDSSAGLFIHTAAQVRQDPLHRRSKPLHVRSHRLVTPSTSRIEGPSSWKLMPHAWLDQPRPISRVSLT